jgi:hypothetical protein
LELRGPTYSKQLPVLNNRTDDTLSLVPLVVTKTQSATARMKIGSSLLLHSSSTCRRRCCPAAACIQKKAHRDAAFVHAVSCYGVALISNQCQQQQSGPDAAASQRSHHLHWRHHRHAAW